MPAKPVTYQCRADGTQLLEIPEGETLHLMTEAELARCAGRSAEFVRLRRLAGAIEPLARTDSGILLYHASQLPAVIRPKSGQDMFHLDELRAKGLKIYE